MISLSATRNFLTSTLEVVDWGRSFFKNHAFLNDGPELVLCTMPMSLIFATLIFQTFFENTILSLYFLSSYNYNVENDIILQ